MAHILIIEDDLTYSTMLRTWLSKKGFTVDTAGRVAPALRLLADGDFDLVLSDMRLPDHDGITVLDWLSRHGRRIPFIVMTSYAEVQNAVLAMKAGACDYVAKPVHPDVLLQKINDALSAAETSATGSQQSAPEPVAAAKSAAGTARPAARRYLEGTSDAARRLYDYVRLVAPTPMSVLILGASGTGKEHVARRIHEQSSRAAGPFVAMDCGALSKEVAASELFGHVKGAFTGAVADKRGAFAEASGGTLFLDEVGNLGYDVQVQLLRAIQEHRVRPVGATREIEADFRLVCATNENLADAVRRGTFREDLFHRVNEFTIDMPRLKDRGADLFLFADFFLDEANRELGRSVAGFDAGASALLARHDWPGNLRELKNVVRRAVLLARSERITEADITITAAQPADAVRPLHDEVAEHDRIAGALRSAGGNKSLAARLLGIDRKTLYNKLEKYGITD